MFKETTISKMERNLKSERETQLVIQKDPRESITSLLNPPEGQQNNNRTTPTKLTQARNTSIWKILPRLVMSMTLLAGKSVQTDEIVIPAEFLKPNFHEIDYYRTNANYSQELDTVIEIKLVEKTSRFPGTFKTISTSHLDPKAIGSSFLFCDYRFADFDCFKSQSEQQERIVDHRVGFEIENTKFLILTSEEDFTSKIKLYFISLANDLRLLKELPSAPEKPESILYMDKKAVAIVGTLSGLFKFDLSAGKQFDQIGTYSELVFRILEKDIATEDSDIFFTYSISNRKFYAINQDTSAQVAELVVTDEVLGISQSQKTTNMIILLLDYEESGNHFGIIKDYTAGPIEFTEHALVGTTLATRFLKIWSQPETDTHIIGLTNTEFAYLTIINPALTMEDSNFEVNVQNNDQSYFDIKGEGSIINSAIFFQEYDSWIMATSSKFPHASLNGMVKLVFCPIYCGSCTGEDPFRCTTCGPDFLVKNSYVDDNGYVDCIYDELCVPPPPPEDNGMYPRILTSEDPNKFLAYEDYFHQGCHEDATNSCSNLDLILTQGEKECVPKCPNDAPFVSDAEDSNASCNTANCETNINYRQSPSSNQCVSVTECTAELKEYFDITSKLCHDTCDGVGEVVNMADNLCIPKLGCSQAENLVRTDASVCVDLQKCRDLSLYKIPPGRLGNEGYNLCSDPIKCIINDLVLLGPDFYECETKPICSGGGNYIDLWDGKCLSSDECIAKEGFLNRLDESDINFCEKGCSLRYSDDTDPIYTNFETKECYTAFFCDDDSRYLKMDTSECVTRSTCVDTYGYKYIKDRAPSVPYGLCIKNCESHPISNHLDMQEDSSGKDERCLHPDNCPLKMETEEGKQCVTVDQCVETLGYYTHTDTYCLEECFYSEELFNDKSYYTIHEDKSCIKEHLCRQFADGYTKRHFDRTCVSEDTCKEFGFFPDHYEARCTPDCVLTSQIMNYDFSNGNCYFDYHCKFLNKKLKMCLDEDHCGFSFFAHAASRSCLVSCSDGDDLVRNMFTEGGSCDTEANCLAGTAIGSDADTSYLSIDPLLCVSASDCFDLEKFTYYEPSTLDADLGEEGYYCLPTCPSVTIHFISATERKCLTVDECKVPSNTGDVQHYYHHAKGCMPIETCTADNFFVNEEVKECSFSCSEMDDLEKCKERCMGDVDCELSCSSSMKMYFDPVDYVCRSDQECKAIEDNAGNLVRLVLDEDLKACLTKTQCQARGGFPLVAFQRCLISCDFFDGIYEKTDSNECVQGVNCPDLAHKNLRKCVTTAECGTLGHFTTNDGNDCVADCNDAPDEQNYLQVEENTCYSEEDCKSSHYVYEERSQLKCTTRANCFTLGRKIVESLRTCVEECEPGFYLVEKTAGEPECIPYSECKAITTPDQLYSYHVERTCITATACKAKGAYIEDETKRCVAQCSEIEGLCEKECDSESFTPDMVTACTTMCGSLGDHGTFADSEQNTCYTEAACQMISSLGGRSRAALISKKLCLTDNQCISDHRGFVYESGATRECVSDCDSKSPQSGDPINYVLADLSNLGYCIDRTSCAAKTSPDHYINIEKRVCLSESDCRATSFTESSSKICQPECSLGTDQVVDNIAPNNCISESTCTGSGFLGSDPKTCYSADECKDADMFTEGTSCVQKCTAGNYALKIATAWSCLSDTECADPANTGGVQHYFSDGIEACIIESECKSIGFIEENSKACLFDCTDDPNSNQYADVTDRVCRDISSCQGVGGASPSRAYHTTSNLCLQTAECSSIAFGFIKSTRECVPDCSTTDEENIDGRDKSLCVSTATCTDGAGRGEAVNALTNTCIAPGSCTSAGDYLTSSDECVKDCPDGEFFFEADKLCVDQTACEAKTDPEQHYTEEDSAECITATKCSTLNKYLSETAKKCVDSCTTTGGTDDHFDLETSLCISDTDCKAKADDGGALIKSTHTASTGDLLCLTDSECTGEHKGFITPTRECVIDCSTEAATPLKDSSGGTATTCISVADCTASNLEKPSTKECVTSAQCIAKGMKVTGTKCESICPDGKYLYDSGTGLSCVDDTTCRGYSTPTGQHVTLGEGFNLCIPEATCTSEGRFLVDSENDCLTSCKSHASKHFADESDSTCYDQTGCNTLEAPAEVTKLIREDINRCVTQAECTSAGLKTITDDGKCVLTCIGTSHEFTDGADPTNCISATDCEGRPDGFKRETQGEMTCETQVSCNSEGMYTIEATNECSDYCPAGEYKNDLAGVKTCIDATTCKAISDPSQHYVLDKEETGQSECIPESQCTTLNRLLKKDTFECVASCPLHPTHTYILNGECITQGQCVAITTPAQLYTQETTNLCITLETCTTTDSMFVIDETKDCVHECPADRWLDTPNSLCLLEATCKGSNLIADFTTPQSCITSQECLDLNAFINEDESECLTQCPTNDSGKEHWILDQPNSKCINEDDCKALLDGEGYIYTDEETCIDAATCIAIPYFFNPVTQECVASCEGTYFPYNPSGELECVDQTECTTTKSSFVQVDSHKCLTKTECTADGRFTQEGNPNCLETCPEGTYHQISDNTCVSLEDCKAAGSNVFESEKSCVTDEECTSLGRGIKEGGICACEPSTPYFDTSSQNCLNQIGCTSQENKVTHNETLTCITKDQCRTNGFNVLELWEDCVEDCKVAAAAPFNYVKDDQICVSTKMCRRTDDHYYQEDGDQRCIDSSTCIALQGKITPESGLCLSGCTAPYTYTSSDTNSCYSAAGCQLSNGLYTKNSTDECINKAECTSGGSNTIEEWSDCLISCPTADGEHKYLEATDSLCLRDYQCKDIDNHYTKDDNTCVTLEECTTGGSVFLTRSGSECLSDCSNSATHFYLHNQKCINAFECRSIEDGYTLNSTGQTFTCITKSECEAIPGLITPSYQDCADACPEGVFLHDSFCLTTEECHALGKFSDGLSTPGSPVCSEACPSPLFHIVSTGECVEQCPGDKLINEETRHCYTEPECESALGIYPDVAQGTCIDQCLGKIRESRTGTCIDESECSDLISSDGKCFKEMKLNNLSSNDNIDEIPIAERKSNPDQDREIVEIPLNLDIPLRGVENFIGGIDYSFLKLDRNLRRRVLDTTGSLKDFNLVEVRRGEYKLVFTPPLSENFFVRVSFKEDFEVYIQEEDNEFPTLYKINLGSLVYEVEANQPPGDLIISESIALGLDTLTKTAPIIATSFKAVSSFRTLPMASATYNKISVYARASSQNLKYEDYKSLQNSTFIDWTGYFNKFIMKRISREIVEDDKFVICEKIESKECHTRHSANFLLNKTLWILAFVILLGLSFKFQVVKYGLIPIYWYSNQQLVLYDLVFNIAFLTFTPIFNMLGSIVTLLLALGITGGIVFISLGVIRKNKSIDLYMVDLFDNVFFDLFSDKKKMTEYFIAKFGFELFTAIVIVTMTRVPKIQGVVLFLVELGNLVFFIIRKHFKNKNLHTREIVINALFVLLSVATMVLGLLSNNGTLLDLSVFILSWVILFAEYSFLLLLIVQLKTKKRTPVDRKKYHMTVEQKLYKPPMEPKGNKRVLSSKAQIPSKRAPIKPATPLLELRNKEADSLEGNDQNSSSHFSEIQISQSGMGSRLPQKNYVSSLKSQSQSKSVQRGSQNVE